MANWQLNVARTVELADQILEQEIKNGTIRRWSIFYFLYRLDKLTRQLPHWLQVYCSYVRPINYVKIGPFMLSRVPDISREDDDTPPEIRFGIAGKAIHIGITRSWLVWRLGWRKVAYVLAWSFPGAWRKGLLLRRVHCFHNGQCVTYFNTRGRDIDAKLARDTFDAQR